jgi:fructose-1,6-bisphosphatase/inositol monophosphatase family enzyme
VSEYDQYLDFAKELALEAGGIIRRYFEGEDMSAEIKDDHSALTLADTTINELVINQVKARFPEHGIIGEEGSYEPKRKNLWIVDPVDGTNEFVLGLPVSVFSVAYVEDGRAKIGVVYDPYTERLYSAVLGGGAYENDRRLDLSDYKSFGRMTVSHDVQGATGWSIFKDADIYGLVANALNTDGKTGFLNLPYVQAAVRVAAGKMDAHISSNKKVWDFAASGLIASEAGAKVTDIFGNPISRADKEVKGCCIAAPHIHDQIMKAIKPVVESMAND